MVMRRGAPRELAWLSIACVEGSGSSHDCCGKRWLCIRTFSFNSASLMGRFVRVTGEGGVDVRSAMMAIGKLRVGGIGLRKLKRRCC